MAITKVQQSSLLTQLWTPDDDWQAPGNVTLSGVAAGNLLLTFGAWWDAARGNGAAQGIPTDTNGTLAAGISPTLPDTTPAPGWPVSGQICRILSAAAGSHVITPPTVGAYGDGLFFAAEFGGGAAGTWTQVEVNSNIALSGTPGAVDGVSVSTAGSAQVGDLVVALCTTDGDPSAIGVGAPAGFANEILLTTTTTVNIAAGAGWMIATSAGAQTASWTWADTACQLGQACIAVFRFTPSAPTITAQPTDQTVNNGATATFSVTATGATSYQWKRNGSNVGTSSNSYTTPAVAYSDQGAQYTVDCINANGTTTSVAATLRVAFKLSGTGPRAYPNLGAPFAAGAAEALVRGQAAAGGGATVNGQTLTAVASVIAGAVTGAATVSGQTPTSTASVIAGAVQAAATVSGQVVTAVASLIAGAVTAAATVNGQTATVNASVLAGTASGGGATVVNGQTLTVNSSVIAGTVEAAALVDAQVITVVASAIAGTVQAAATIAGQLLTSTASVIAGAVTAAADVAGQTLTVNASVLAGTASGGGAATVNGQTLTVNASVIAGSVTAAALVDGQLLTVNASVIAGGAFVPSADAALQSKALRTGVGMGL